MKKSKSKTIVKLGKLMKNPKNILLLFLVVILVIILCVVFWGKEGEQTIETTNTLKRIVKTENLNTVQYTYNAVTQEKNKDGKVKYYVAYEGIVKAGVEFDEIKIETDEKNKIITITIPDVQITETVVDSDSLEFIFTKDKYDTKEVLNEALKLCEADLKSRALEEELLLVAARENAISGIKTFFQPWIDTLDEDYKVTFVQQEVENEK